ncbi:Ribonuclease HI protein [Halorhabdus tiamatea SARL4B]|uniref:Ribonuclease HI protein n=1 Tax=Halorhabdus tiamatea SARL4B TaxID=1033806 RepID=U2DJR8_9EURY|nr:Ribonuclease HI protein [Halorhabdus tiamatea SARL4B]
MPVIECDPSAARERLEAAGIAVESGNTDHECWRAESGGATAVAYDGKVVVQGADPGKLTAVLAEEGGRAHVYVDGASRGNPGPAAIGWVILTGDGGIVHRGGQAHRFDDQQLCGVRGTHSRPGNRRRLRLRFRRGPERLGTGRPAGPRGVGH